MSSERMRCMSMAKEPLNTKCPDCNRKLEYSEYIAQWGTWKEYECTSCGWFKVYDEKPCRRVKKGRAT